MTKADLERRIIALEAENAALKHERENLRKLICDRQAFPVQYVSQGCVCPPDAQANCHNPTCPRKLWTVTSATSQPHHPRDTTW